MGAWGEAPFDNDDAADWSADFDGLDAASGTALLRRTLAAGAESGHLESDQGSVAVAAAQLVAWMVSPGSVQESPYSEVAVAWLRTAGTTADPSLVAAAKDALTRVAGPDSELAELWDESGSAGWRASIQRIEALLG